jgi:hypothetical protein
VCKLYGKTCHKLTRQDDCVRALQFGPCSFSCFINWEVLSPRFRIACVSGWFYQILPFYETCHRGIPLHTWYVSEIQGSLQFHMTSASFALCISIHSFIHSRTTCTRIIKVIISWGSSSLFYIICVLGKLKSISEVLQLLFLWLYMAQKYSWMASFYIINHILSWDYLF